MKLKVIKSTGKNSSMQAADSVFSSPVNQVLLAQAIRVYFSNQRQGTSKTQRRGDVNRTTRKWYRQKGTGNARHGAKDATLFVGGAIAHGPTGQENWKKNLPKRQKNQALVSALSAQQANILVNQEIAQLKGKTKPAFELLTKIVASFDQGTLAKDRVLLVFDQVNEKIKRAISNLPKVSYTTALRLNVLDIAQADRIIFTKEAVKALETRLESETSTNQRKKTKQQPKKETKTTQKK